ncbi:MAG TPA: sigma-70 family RNA polymerase sigma factor [Streptosporangiaceae bacterium]|nr:sigma-70 family RNA polymerase sigma factor [Streptosporangiaceae bacterium]
MGTTNSELVAGATAGDQRAWDALVERYTSLLWAIARSYRLPPSDAADVVQTTWLRLVEHLERIADPDRLPGWLATTARRECLRLLRRADREVYSASGVRDAPDDGPAPDAALLAGERDAILWAAFARLDDFCQRLLRVLSADPPPSYAVVSVALDMKIGSIGPTRARCLAKLRQLLPESEQLP